MKCRLIGILSALSLALCIGVVVLWVRSFWYGTGLNRVTGPPQGWSVGVYEGMIYVSEWDYFREPRGWRFCDERIPASRPPDRYLMVFPGVHRGGAAGHRYVRISLFYPVALTAWLPLWRIYLVVRLARPPASRGPEKRKRGHEAEKGT